MITRKSTRQGLMLMEDRPIQLVPIYGLSEIPIEKRSNWEPDPTHISTVQMKNWTGDPPVEFSFSWELIAGTNAEVDSREKLITFMRRAQAMCSFTKDNRTGVDIVGPPPLVRLVLGNYVAAKGVLTSCNTIAKGPFTNQYISDQSGQYSDLLPTSVMFSITFLALPGYNQNLKVLDIDKSLAYDSNSVLKRLYKSF